MRTWRVLPAVSGLTRTITYRHETAGGGLATNNNRNALDLGPAEVVSLHLLPKTSRRQPRGQAVTHLLPFFWVLQRPLKPHRPSSAISNALGSPRSMIASCPV